jgi:hypothetical protein
VQFESALPSSHFKMYLQFRARGQNKQASSPLVLPQEPHLLVALFENAIKNSQIIKTYLQCKAPRQNEQNRLLLVPVRELHLLVVLFENALPST